MTQVKGTLGKEGSSGLMSAEELKARLQQHFVKSGTINNLKTQLRNQLVKELFKIAELPNYKLENEFSEAEAKKTLLPLQVSNWLVYNHLKRQGYDYSLSTFVTEANVFFPEELLSLTDVLDLLGIKSESEESKTITEHYIHCKHGSFLHSLLRCVMKQHKKHNPMDLNCKEKKYKSNIDSMTEGNISIHHQPDQNGSWTEPQVEQLRPKLLYESQNDLETHQQKLHQMLQSKKEEQENEVQRLRQKLLQELDRLYEHEQQVRLELEQRRSHLTREQELLDIEKSKLKARELELQKHSSYVETKNQKIYQIKEEHLSASLKKKEEEVAELEDRLKQQEQRLNEENQILNDQKREIEDLRNQLHQSEKRRQDIQNECSILQTENVILKEKVENAADYEHIKTELLKNLKEAENYNMEVKEIKESSEAEKHALLSTVKNLEEQLKMCLQKSNSLKDIGVSTETLLQDESMWNQQKDKLEQELSETKQLYHKVLQKLQEQNEDIQDLHLAIHVLNDQISDPTNRGKRVPEAEGPNSHPVPPLAIPGLDIRPTQLQRTHVPHIRPSYNAQYPGLFYPSPVVQRTSREDPYKFISDARKRISDLEQEAQAVKRKYSVFVAQMKLPPPSYITYGHAFRSYDSMNSTNQDYRILSSKDSALSFMHTGDNDKHDNKRMLSFMGDPRFAASHYDNNEKTLGHQGLTNPQDVDPQARNLALPHNRHVQFQNDENFVSYEISPSEAVISNSNSSTLELHHGPMQKLNTYPNKKENNLQSHVRVRSSHKHPISYDSASESVSHDLQFSSQLHDNGEQLLSTANIASTSQSSGALKHSGIDQPPFHLSKFGLYNTGNKTLISPLTIAHSQVQPSDDDSKSEMQNHAEKKAFHDEIFIQENLKMPDTSTLNSQVSLNHISNVNKQSFLGPELLGEQGEEHLISVSEKQVESQVSNHCLEQTEHQKNVLSEQVDSENSSLSQALNEVANSQTVPLKPNKTIDLNGDIKKLNGETLEMKRNFGKAEDCTEINGTKPKVSVPLRCLSVDLDSAWKQQAGSLSLAVKNFVRPRSGSSHSLPSRFDLAEAAVELKSDVKPSLTYGGVIQNEVSSPRSHSFSETHLTNAVEKMTHESTGNHNNAVAIASNIAMHQPSEDLINPHESFSDISNHMDAENIEYPESPKKQIDAINLDSTKHSNSSEITEKEEQFHADNDSHISVIPEGHTTKQSEDESDHDSSSNAKSLPHVSQQDNDESVASTKQDVSVPSKLNVDVAASNLLQVKNSELDTEVRTIPSASEIDNQDSVRSCENEAGSVKVDRSEGKSASVDQSGGVNYDNEGGLDESGSELSELNFSAGNDELEGSKSEESGW